MIQGFITKLFGTSHERQLKKIQPRVDAINGLEPQIKKLTDDQLRAKTAEFRQKVDNGASLDDIWNEAFAVCREGGRRALGMRHYDVQLIGGSVLHSGRIAEMRTGEGKTLVATLACYLNALSGKGVHVVTVNDYLARRDAEWMGKLYSFLGLSWGVVAPQQGDSAKRAAYRADITYGQNNEFGFDYLRDNMKFSIYEYAQRELNFAIVDEVDSILVDEARTPLIISGDNQKPSDKYLLITDVIPRLRKDDHYVVDEKAHSVTLTDEGIALAAQLLFERKITQERNLFDPVNLESIHILQQSLRAHALYKRDQHYIVSPDQKIVIVDEFTGRTLAGRRWSDGLHQAVEAKERVDIQPENRTLATISFQNYFRLYRKLSGMTGTADTEATEFNKIYSLDVVVIPTNKPIKRIDYDDLVYKSEREKFGAVFEQVMECHKAGQPVLVGTTSVEKSEALARMLTKASVPYNLLNAKQHEREAYIVAQAGRKGAITIATNMAGRGTDILLGGNPEMLGRMEVLVEAEAEAKRAGADRPTTSNEDDELDAPPPPPTDTSLLINDKPRFDAAVELAQKKYTEICATEKKEVLAAGGLQIIGTERHESRRIDNQLRGRAGRQGDPGASRFYLSLKDDLMRIFAGDRIESMMTSLGMEEGVPIEHPWVTKSVENAQKKVEERNFDIRKNLLEYDDVMNQQRKSIYSLRKQVLEGQYRTVPTEEERKAGKEPEPVVKEARKEYVDLVKPAIARFVRFYAVPGLAPDASPEERDRWRRVVAEGSIDDVKEVRAAAFERNVYESFGCRLSVEKLAKEPKKLYDVTVAAVAMSLTEQRERLLNLIDDVVSDMVEEFCPPRKNVEDWRLDELEEAYRTSFGIRAQIHGFGDASDIAHKLYHEAEALIEGREKQIGPDLHRMTRNLYLREIDRQWLEHLTTMEQLRDGIGLRGWAQRDPRKEYKKEGYDIFVRMTKAIQQAVVANVFKLEAVREEDVQRIEELRRQESEAQLGRTRAPAAAPQLRPQPGLSAAQAAAIAAAARARGAAAPASGASGPASTPPRASNPGGMSAAQVAALQAAAARASTHAQRTGAGTASTVAAAGAAPAAGTSGTTASGASPEASGAGAPVARVDAPKADPAKGETVRRDRPKIGRNEPCWCGSGKKYKNCHMKDDGQQPADDKEA